MGHEGDILDLVLSSAGKTAPYMTQKLSVIGDGSMAEGISALANFAAKSGMEIGEKVGIRKGVGLGVLGTLTLIGTVKVALDFRQKRIERIAALREADSRMRIDGIEAESAQADEESLGCDVADEHKDESKER